MKTEKEKLKSQESGGPRKGQGAQERLRWETWLCPASPCCPLGLCSLLCRTGGLPSLWDPPLLGQSGLPAIWCHGGKRKRGYKGSNTSPWDPGVQDSQADQEHPACPAEGQGAIRSKRDHRFHCPRDPTLRAGSQPPPSNVPTRLSALLPESGFSPSPGLGSCFPCLGTKVCPSIRSLGAAI